MDKKPNMPVRKLGTPSEPHTGVQKKPKVPPRVTKVIKIVPADHPIGPHWSGIP